MKAILQGTLVVVLATRALAGEAARPAASAGGTAAPNGAPVVEHFRTAFSGDVIAPNVLNVSNVGRVRLIGLSVPDPAAAGYQKAIKATQKYALRKSVKLDVCAARDKDEQGNVRAQVYFMEGGQWHSLNQKLLRAGLASVRRESPCHVDLATWIPLVQQARSAKRGLFGMGIELPDEAAAPMPLSRATSTAPVLSTGRMDAINRSSNASGPVAIASAPVRIMFVGNIQTQTFHALDCFCSPGPLDRIFFADRFNAVKAGYRPCVVCRPK